MPQFQNINLSAKFESAYDVTKNAVIFAKYDCDVPTMIS